MRLGGNGVGEAEGGHAQYWYLMFGLMHCVTYALFLWVFAIGYRSVYSESTAGSHSTLGFELLLNALHDAVSPYGDSALPAFRKSDNIRRELILVRMSEIVIACFIILFILLIYYKKKKKLSIV